MGDLQGSFEDGPKFNRKHGISLVNPGDEIELPWSTKKPINQLLEQLEAKVSPFWSANTIGNPQNAFLTRNT